MPFSKYSGSLWMVRLPRGYDHMVIARKRGRKFVIICSRDGSACFGWLQIYKVMPVYASSALTLKSAHPPTPTYYGHIA